MALTIETSPADYARCYDTNRLMYKISSTNYAQANFRFYIILYVFTGTFPPTEELVRIRKRPLSDGTCFFNPAEIFSNYLTHDLDIDFSGKFYECLNSSKGFRIGVLEEYGSTPTVQWGTWVKDDVTLYNGLQEYIPYDIEAYGGGNQQWVMSGGTSYPYGWWDRGNWFYDPLSTGLGRITFDQTLGITGITEIVVSYTDGDGLDKLSPINKISAGDPVLLRSNQDDDKSIMIKFDDQISTTTQTTWSGVTLIDQGSTMPETGFDPVEIIHIVATNPYNDVDPGQGKFLTDAFNYQVDTTDYALLYFLRNKVDQPTHVRLKVFYWNSGISIIEPDPGGGGGIGILGGYTNNSKEIIQQINPAYSSPNPTIGIAQNEIPSPAITGITTQPPDVPQIAFNKYYISSYYTGFTLGDLTDGNSENVMYAIPSGPMNYSGETYLNQAENNSGWVYYQVDLTDGLDGGSIVFNKYPMTYYRKTKCNKYDSWQLFWLNPHGGFDRYTFYMKNYMSYDLQRTMWEHRFSDTYVLGERGKTTYKTKAVENVLLNTDWLTSNEAQILSQLEMSPEVFALYQYKGIAYKIPYVINDTKFDYKEIKNEKMVAMEINVTPAWNRTSQTT